MESRIALRSSAVPSMQRRMAAHSRLAAVQASTTMEFVGLGKDASSRPKNGTAVCKTPKTKKPHLGEVRLSC